MSIELLPEPERYFKSFCDAANKGLLHHKDWDRFYKFVWRLRAYPGRVPNEDQMADMLCANGFSRDYAERISSTYLHLIDFKWANRR